ncbi:uncharacterized protein GGS22DRAFT_154623 [Annulohypoxylon maeteangense]|uniref:uncharacterized protein n=1 Tax=Annulohypoxylon maeteangense TaxID=1927788 RepID=UPI002008B1CE|nr:uncharacterized protein GGS22DRAFT_154623 [Annulohypoxylon maeteangense]KAI0887944.1 hypothetical protein GGS22DRAFT_154623 [Annulohypoxylon maeteangense]
MSVGENVGAALLVFFLVLAITVALYGGISSAKYFGLAMFRNKRAEREFLQRQRHGEEVLERFEAAEQARQLNLGGGGGSGVRGTNGASDTNQESQADQPTQSTQPSEPSAATHESQQQQTEESQREQTTEASEVSEAVGQRQTSSTVAVVGW